MEQNNQPFKIQWQHSNTAKNKYSKCLLTKTPKLYNV